jgi:ribonuclease E
MSRQRIRSSVLESSTEKCPHCGGTGHVRSVSSVALQLLRSLDEMLLKGATHNLTVRTRSEIALYLLNHKRAHLRALEERFRIVIMVNADATVEGQISFVIEKGEQVHSLEQAKALALQPATAVPATIDEDEDEDDFEAEDTAESEDRFTAVSEEEAGPEGEPEQDQGQDQGAEGGQGRKRRRRRRGRRGEGREAAQPERDGGAFAPEHAAEFAPQPGENDLSQAEEVRETGSAASGAETPGESNGEAERRRRRRGRRGGRRNRRGREGEGVAAEGANGEQPEFERAVANAEDRGSDAEPEAPAVPVPTAEPQHDVGAQSEVRSNSEPRPEPGPEPAHTSTPEITASVVPETAAAERSRRRSTVREPVTQVLRDEGAAAAPPMPAAEPVVSSPAEDESSDRPRRSGWWSKRVLGRS